jgi:hypothetical protein
MANILLGYRKVLDKRGVEVMTYSNSTHKAILDQGHAVTPMGEGHEYEYFTDIGSNFLGQQALFIDLDCGRNSKGDLSFQTEKPPIPSAVRYIDTHGYPTLHKRLAENYDHVFFAVWDRRDIFTNHPSVHWCPNASDAHYFYKDVLPVAQHEARPFDVGFFGSKGGIDRADVLEEICARHSWVKDIREIGKKGHRWPRTSEAMALCRVLFNKGQKHDGPNQRVIESMLMGRPLVTDRDPRDGMKELFEEGTHYLSYGSDAELADNLGWCLREPSLAASMAHRAYELAYAKHQVKHRVEQILEVCGVKD